MEFEGIPGHEFVAEVVEGSARFPAGTRVVGEINCGCGTCDSCRSGWERHCPNRTVLGILGRNGCMAERFCLPDANLHAVPEGVSDQEAVLVELLAAACRIIEQKAIPEPGAEVAILGDGRLGILVARVLDAAGFRVHLFGRHADGRRVLLQDTGVTVADIAALDRRFPAIVDCTGRSAGLAAALDHLEPRGTLILKTTTFEPPPVHPARLVIDEISVIGSRCGPFAMALEMMQQGILPPAGFVEKTYPLADALAAFDHATKPGTLKILIGN
jgi:alcohol dehydrogenase